MTRVLDRTSPAPRRRFTYLAAMLALVAGCGENKSGSGGPNAQGGGSGMTGSNAGAGGSNAGGGNVAGSAGSSGNGMGGGSAGDAGASAGGASGAGGNGVGGGSADLPVLKVGDGQLKIEVCTENVIRVAFAKSEAFFTRPTLAAAPKRCGGTTFTQTVTDTEARVTTAKVDVRVELPSGRVRFLDPAGNPILVEKAGSGRTLTPATIQGDMTNNVRQEWEPNADEALYGLGQHQYGLLDIKGYDLDLKQYNTQVTIPFLVSSRGYGVLWDNTSFSKFGDTRPFVPLPNTTGLYTTGGAGAVNPGNGVVDWTGTLQAGAAGDYLFQTYASGDVKLWVNNTLVIDHFRQFWLPYTELARIRLQANQTVPVRLQWTREVNTTVNAIRLLYKTPTEAPTTSLWSEVGDGVDYYFVYGPELDSVVAGYRRVTGEAPMMPKWAFGLWQSRERYQNAQQSLDVLAGFRSRSIPIDNIVQDWQYWTEPTWGSHAFDATRWPDPAGWIRAIHDTHHARLMISVWPKFYPGTANFEALRAGGFLYPLNLTEQRMDFVGHPFTFYDAFNPAARAMYWAQMQRELFTKNVDAWWMDATEPDIVEGPFLSPDEQLQTFKTHMHPTALGSGSRMLNAYSLVNSQAVYEGQRAAAPDQRVFILTRNGFAGQQRYAAATWSGDITSTWTAFKKQIPAGLGFSISGIPYWTVDSGGFAVPARFATNPTAAALAEWRELNTRWFQYATFLPLLRVHGQAPVREMWEFGGDTSPAFQAQLKFDRLRYRLLPYLYSLAGKVTHEGGTMLRPLVMDFRGDPLARAVSDQYLFGPALLVSPVTSYQAANRSVYLPAGGWYDFWSGAAVMGGRRLDVATPYDSIPVHVRAGSIIPFGPDLQYTTEKPANPITLYVYAGANGSFTLYEDDGLTYAYERNAFTRIPLTWDDASRTLTIGRREGSFPEMLMSRTFHIVLVSANGAVGFPFAQPAGAGVTYVGEPVTTQL